MRLTFLGTGSTSAPPLHGCECEVCTAARSDDSLRRRPASALVEAEGTRLLLDGGLMDLTERFPAREFPIVLLTHFHVDHVQGLFHLRWGMGPSIPVYCPRDDQGCADLYKHAGKLDFRPLEKFAEFSLGGIGITTVPLIHSKVTLGYCLEHEGTRIAYLTDTAGLPPATADFLRRWAPTALVLDCSQPPLPEAPRNHNDLGSALELIAEIGPDRAWLTHIGHELDGWLRENSGSLPPNVAPARDGQVIDFPLQS